MQKLFVPPRLFIPPRGLIAGEVLSRSPQGQRRTLLIGRDSLGNERWSGYFRNREDAEHFIIASLTGELWFDETIWHLPSPQWHPDYGPLVYEFAIALDGSATGVWASGTSFTITSFTTTKPGDVIGLVVCAILAGTAISVSSVSASGTTGWARRKSTLIGGSTGNTVEFWYGTAAATLAAVTVTITLSTTPQGANAVVFGISGANTVSISDSNVALPATGTNTSSSTPTVSGVSTSNANDMIIGAYGKNSTATTQTAGAGFTLIANANSGSVSSASAEYEVVSSTQSSVSVTYGVATTNWAMIVDAVQALSSTGAHNQTILRPSWGGYRWRYKKPRRLQ